MPTYFTPKKNLAILARRAVCLYLQDVERMTAEYETRLTQTLTWPADELALNFHLMSPRGIRKCLLGLCGSLIVEYGVESMRVMREELELSELSLRQLMMCYDGIRSTINGLYEELEKQKAILIGELVYG